MGPSQDRVSNGNGVNRMARRVGNFLKGNGVILMYLSNASHFNHEETKIYYTRGYLREACQLAQKLVGRQSLEEIPTVRGGKAEISILIGKDLVPLALFQKGGRFFCSGTPLSACKSQGYTRGLFMVAL
jgi:hypothetical protein